MAPINIDVTSHRFAPAEILDSYVKNPQQAMPGKYSIRKFYFNYSNENFCLQKLIKRRPKLQWGNRSTIFK